MEHSFLAKLEKASDYSAEKLRSQVIEKHIQEPGNKNIYPYEAHFTAMVYHMLVEKKVSMENLRIESRYRDWSDRYDLNYWDEAEEVDYFTEVKLIFKLNTGNELKLSGRGGYDAIEKDLEKLGKLPKRSSIKPVMIVAYVGYQPYSEVDVKKWERQIPHDKHIILHFS